MMANQTTARDLGFLVYHFINQYPDIFNYTTATSHGQWTPYEENLDTYNYSSPWKVWMT